MASSSFAFQAKFNELMVKKSISRKKALMAEAIKFYSFCQKRIEGAGNCPFPCYLVDGFLKPKANEVTKLFYALHGITRDAIAFCYANSNDEATALLPVFSNDGIKTAIAERVYTVEQSFLDSLANFTSKDVIVNCKLI